ncbi:uncharacterized protein RAG0_10404 [Rhynchosporium agropyri]|uniref:Uncharacterized protein n=1 Tax=Rhynchosporium agropyri TaxID=914238 RepID=A0A1E1L2D6_9HELO|nr:uncharacterized protein RAG0_10404 [Rhynchosporium agropyri]
MKLIKEEFQIVLIKQNQPTFELEPLEKASLLFKEKLLSKTLDPIKENPEDPKNYRNITIKCLFKGYRITNKIIDISDTESSQGSKSSTILDAFARQRVSKRRETERDQFDINRFKNLLLNFIISNNISFRAISSISFKELAFYLNDYFINTDFKLKSYLLAIRPLIERHSSDYIFKVLLETIKEYNIEYNISTITRDNASSNTTLITRLKEYYIRESIKFQGDIAYLAHVLNLVF